MNNCRNFEEEIKLIYSSNKSRYNRIIREDQTLFDWLVKRCADFTDYLPEMVYSVICSNESPYCESGNKRKFRTITTGWNRCDVKGCKYCLARSTERSKKTSLERFGVDNPMKDSRIKAKVVESATVNNSYNIAAEKRKQYYLATMGVDHPWKTADGKKAHEEIMLKKYGCVNPSSSEKISRKKRQNNLKKYGVEHAIQSEVIQEKISNTLYERYGVENPSQIPEVQAKIVETSMKKYGVTHFTQSAVVINKAQATNIKRYGETNYNKTAQGKKKSAEGRLDAFFSNLSERVPAAEPLFSREEYTGVHNGQEYKWRCNACNNSFVDGMDDGKIPRCNICYPSYKSLGEHELGLFIESLGISFIRNSRSVISPMELDIYIPEKKIAIEFNGVYFHSELSGSKERDYHLNKRQACEKLDIQLIQILDVEWNHCRDLVESRIKQKLGISTVIYARKCSIVALESAVANDFHRVNHIQSVVNSSINFGLLHENVLVSVMSFSKSRYSKLASYELLRFSTIKNHTVVGGAAKLLTAFEKQYNTPSIVSYCDLRWNTGQVYQKIGFKLHNQSPPNYWYHKNGGVLESRVKYQKHKLSRLLTKYDSTLSEWENMVVNGYDRIWDCGNYVFLKNVLDDIN